MTRAILGTPKPLVDVVRVVERTRSGAPGGADNVQLQERLRRRRGKSYVQRTARLDAGRHVSTPSALAEVLQAIAIEFPDLTLDERPLGIVAACHLGAPYEVHTCDLIGGIIEHFEMGRAMPPHFERARSLASHGAYAFVEIYPDALRAVAEDGSVAVL